MVWTVLLKDQYGPRNFFLEFPFFAKNMIIKSILNLWWHFKILKLFANGLMPHFAFYNETRNDTFLVVIR